MRQVFFEELLVFSGLMATLGCATRVVLASIRRRTAPPPENVAAQLADIAARLERVEQTVDATAVEVERIGEGQRFTAKLVAGRAPTTPLRAEGERGRVVTPH